MATKTIDTLKRFSRHNDDCRASPLALPTEGGESACTCGLTDALISSGIELGKMQQVIEARSSYVDRMREIESFLDGDFAPGAYGRLVAKYTQQSAGLLSLREEFAKVTGAYRAAKDELANRQATPLEAAAASASEGARGNDGISCITCGYLPSSHQQKKDLRDVCDGYLSPSGGDLEVKPADVVADAERVAAAAVTLCTCGHEANLHVLRGACTSVVLTTPEDDWKGTKHCPCKTFDRAEVAS